MRSNCKFDSETENLSEDFSAPIITDNPTQKHENTFDINILIDISPINLSQIESGANFSDRYPILFENELNDQPQLLGSKPQIHFSFSSMHALAKLRGCWLLVSFQNHLLHNNDEIYSHLQSTTIQSLGKK